MKMAQDYMSPYSGGQAMGGFNSRLYGESWSKACGGMPAGSDWAARDSGWRLANKMIMEGKIFSETEVNGKTITFKCFQDGDQYCCVGEGFENLQESNNYAFGCSFDAAIVNFALKEKSQ